jgi:hypothetical protein
MSYTMTKACESFIWGNPFTFLNDTFCKVATDLHEHPIPQQTIDNISQFIVRGFIGFFVCAVVISLLVLCYNSLCAGLKESKEVHRKAREQRQQYLALETKEMRNHRHIGNIASIVLLVASVVSICGLRWIHVHHNGDINYTALYTGLTWLVVFTLWPLIIYWMWRKSSQEEYMAKNAQKF